jgi:hypothetical protein
MSQILHSTKKEKKRKHEIKSNMAHNSGLVLEEYFRKALLITSLSIENIEVEKAK